MYRTRRGDHVVVVKHGPRTYQFTSDHNWPEVSAQWVNSKLVYVERHFNHFFGHYWLFDVHLRQVVLEEFITDGSEIEKVQIEAIRDKQPLPEFLVEVEDPKIAYLCER